MESSEEEDDFPSIESIIPQSKVDSLYQSHTEKVRFLFISESTNNAYSNFLLVHLHLCSARVRVSFFFFFFGLRWTHFVYFSGDQEALLRASRFEGCCGELVRQYALQVLGFFEVTYVTTQLALMYFCNTNSLKLPSNEFQELFIYFCTFCLYFLLKV